MLGNAPIWCIRNSFKTRLEIVNPAEVSKIGHFPRERAKQDHAPDWCIVAYENAPIWCIAFARDRRRPNIRPA
jgi:hypothetical protein